MHPNEYCGGAPFVSSNSDLTWEFAPVPHVNPAATEHCNILNFRLTLLGLKQQAFTNITLSTAHTVFTAPPPHLHRHTNTRYRSRSSRNSRLAVLHSTTRSLNLVRSSSLILGFRFGFCTIFSVSLSSYKEQKVSRIISAADGRREDNETTEYSASKRFKCTGHSTLHSCELLEYVLYTTHLSI